MVRASPNGGRRRDTEFTAGACDVRVERRQDGGPERPAGVPAAAMWIGGSEGGAFVLVRREGSDSGRYRAQIYHENGEEWYAGVLELDPPEGPRLDLTSATAFAGWDGEQLLLVDGRVLRPAQARF